MRTTNDKQNESIDEQTEQIEESVRTIWENKTVDVTVDKPINEVRASFIKAQIPSKTYGFGGRWSPNQPNRYLSLGGDASRGGMPLKASIGGDIVPISSTDVKNLAKLGFIQSRKLIF